MELKKTMVQTLPTFVGCSCWCCYSQALLTWILLARVPPLAPRSSCECHPSSPSLQSEG